VDGAEPLAVESAAGQRCGEAIEVAVDDGLIDAPADPSGVAGGHDRRRQGENDRHGRGARSRRTGNELAAGSALDIGRVNDGELTGGEPTTQLAVKDPEGQPRRTLIRGITRDRLAVSVG
jgi:hypothetical protein